MSNWKIETFPGRPQEGSNLKEWYQALGAAFWPEIRRRIDEVIDTPSGAMVSRMCAYQLDGGGKRLRALLPLRLALALDCDPGPLVPFAAACEVLHNASLVHDDIQDGDAVRRGRPAAWKTFGLGAGICLGDAMLYHALLLVRQLDVPVPIRDRVEQRLLLETLRVIEGQCQELALSARSGTGFAQYLRAAEGKTGGFLSLPLTGAAALCRLPPEVEEGLATAALHLGAIFQIQDDLVDLWGDKGRGCPGNDIREGKPSALVVYCRERSTAAETQWLDDILGKPRHLTTDAEVAAVIGFFERCCGARDFALAEIERQRQAAIRVPQLAAHPILQRLIAEIAELFRTPLAAPAAAPARRVA